MNQISKIVHRTTGYRNKSLAAELAALIDADYYRRTNPDVTAAEADAVAHFLEVGWAEGRNPCALFDTGWYLDMNPDVVAAGLNPLAHYLAAGAAEGRAPHPLFDGAWYMDQHADVKAGGQNPLAHYLAFGWKEGRNPNPLFDGAWYARTHGLPADVEPLGHYVEKGASNGLRPAELFDGAWYLEQNPDVGAAGLNPLVHYLTLGWWEGRRPNPLFDVNWYLEKNADVREAGIEPLGHYMTVGWREGRDPSNRFSVSFYLSKNSDVQQRKIDPLIHYLAVGASEGRAPFLKEKGELLFDYKDVEPDSCTYYTPGTSYGIAKSKWNAKFSSNKGENVDLKNPIRTLAITHNLNHEGAPNSAFELIKGLTARGAINPTVVSLADGPLRFKYEAANIPVEILSSKRPLEGVRTAEQYRERISEIAITLEVGSYDLLYANTVTTFWAIDAAENSRVPSIWNVRESESWKSYFSNLPQPIAAKAIEAFALPYRVIFVANSTMQRWSSVDEVGNFEVIHNGLDLRCLSGAKMSRDEARKRLGLSRDQIAVLALGTVAPRKGQQDLIRALLSMSTDTIRRLRVFIVGSRQTEYLDWLKGLVAAAGEPWITAIEFVGETGNTSAFWRSADMFVCSSRVESYPRVILEAMAYGLPIITTPVYGIAEQVREGVNALVYSPGEVEKLRRHLETLCHYTEFRESLAKQSPIVLGQLQNLDGMLASYERVFRAASHSFAHSSQKFKESCASNENPAQQSYMQRRNHIRENALKPAFREKNIAAVLSTNEVFIPYLGMAVYSLIRNSNPAFNYDIIILASGIPRSMLEKVFSLARGRDNISIRLYDTAELLDSFPAESFHVEGYVPVETYNKCFITDILSGFERCVYLDSDILIVDDIQKLHDIDLSGQSIGASPNVANVYVANIGKTVKGRKFVDYLRNELKVGENDKYFQAGVLVLDMQRLESMDLPLRALKALAEISKPVYFDQCIFNYLFYGDVSFFSTSWNHVWYMQEYSYLRGAVPDRVFFDYAKGRVAPQLIHYAGGSKPQNSIGWVLSDRFWEYAFESPFIDAIKSDVMQRGSEVASVIDGWEQSRSYVLEPRVLIHLHLYYIDQWPFMAKALRSVCNCKAGLFVTMVTKDAATEAAIRAEWPDANIIHVKNCGYDIFPFLQVLNEVDLSKYDLILKIHTKNARSRGQDTVYDISVPGHAWRKELIDSVLGSKQLFRRNLARFKVDTDLGMLGAGRFIFSTKNNHEEETYALQSWRERCGAEKGDRYVGGSMFMARAYPFERLKGLGLKSGDFASDGMRTKDHKNIAHSVERLFGIVVENEGFSIEAGDEFEYSPKSLASN